MVQQHGQHWRRRHYRRDQRHHRHTRFCRRWLSPDAISKAINAGIAAGVATDIDGEPRDAAPDLGADEFRTCWARLNYNATDYGHVQAAVDASTLPADVVKVAGYCPGVQSRTGVTQTVYISKSLTMRGGYTTTNWTTSDPVG